MTMFKAPKILELLPAILLLVGSIVLGYFALVTDIMFILVSLILLVISAILFSNTHKVLKNGLRRIYIKDEYLIIEFTVDAIEQKFIKRINDILKIEYKLDDDEILHIFISDKEKNDYDLAFNILDRQSCYYTCNILDIINK